LQELGLGELAYRLAAGLSGGERQRVAPGTGGAEAPQAIA
jgi:ABC-type sugar transport system ATPase subunit